MFLFEWATCDSKISLRGMNKVLSYLIPMAWLHLSPTDPYKAHLSHLFLIKNIVLQLNFVLQLMLQLPTELKILSSVLCQARLCSTLDRLADCKHFKWLFLKMAFLKLDSCGSNPSLGSLRPATVISGRLKRYQITRSISIKLAQLVERRTRDSVTSMTRVRIPSGAQENFVTFSESKMLCSHVVGVTPLRGKAQIFFP